MILRDVPFIKLSMRMVFFCYCCSLFAADGFFSLVLSLLSFNSFFSLFLSIYVFRFVSLFFWVDISCGRFEWDGQSGNVECGRVSASHNINITIWMHFVFVALVATRLFLFCMPRSFPLPFCVVLRQWAHAHGCSRQLTIILLYFVFSSFFLFCFLCV